MGYPVVDSDRDIGRSPGRIREDEFVFVGHLRKPDGQGPVVFAVNQVLQDFDVLAGMVDPDYEFSFPCFLRPVGVVYKREDELLQAFPNPHEEIGPRGRKLLSPWR